MVMNVILSCVIIRGLIDNQDREYGGLVAAMKELQVDKGVILTMNQSDMASVDGYSIETIPVWKWITDTDKTLCS